VSRITAVDPRPHRERAHVLTYNACRNIRNINKKLVSHAAPLQPRLEPPLTCLPAECYPEGRFDHRREPRCLAR
jgi:hypothetical protein